MSEEREQDPLVRAVAAGDRAAARAALAAGASPDARDACGRSVLMVACARGDAPFARLLLEAGADPDAGLDAPPARGLGAPPERAIAARSGEEVRTPLALAVESGELETVELLLAHGAHPCRAGATAPLDLAALGGDGEIARALLDAGADPNARDSEGDTPLGIAAAAGSCEVVRALLDYGAIASARNDEGCDALTLAAQAGRAEAVRLLAPRFGLRSRLRARRLLRRAARRRPPCSSRTAQLHEDALYGRLAAVRKALAGGHPPDARLAAPARAAAPGAPGDEGAAESAGAGETALALAAQGGHAAIVRALLAAGADPNGRARGDTPLLRALGPRALDPRARPDVIHALVDAGADPEARDADGLTPLMRAVMDGRCAMPTIDALLERGADPAARHASGMTALDLARADPVRAPLAEWLAARIGARQRAAKPEPLRRPVGAPAQRLRRPGPDAPLETLRGLGDPAASEVLVAVRAPIDAVAPAFERLRAGRQWSRDVYGREGFFAPEEGALVYQLRGHVWTLVQSALVDARALRARDARALSRALGSLALWLEICEAQELLHYVVYAEGARAEELEWRGDGSVGFESTLEGAAADALQGLDAVSAAGLRFEALGLFVPGIGDDRLEWLPRHFAPGDFERVDFLRLDEAAPPPARRGV